MSYRLNLAEYAQYGALAIFVAFLGTFARLPFWLYPSNLMLPNGSPDPRAGKLNVTKAVSELAGVPALAALAVTGVLVIFGIQKWAMDDPVLLYCILFVAILLSVLGIAFIYTFIEKLSAPVIDAVGGFFRRLLGGGSK